jgi:hypothetical protein
MITGHIIAALLPRAPRSMRRWLFHLGGIGLIALGLLDSSLIPHPSTAAAVFHFRRGSMNKKGPGHLARVSSEASSSLVVQDNAQQRVVYVEPAIVIDESQLLEFVHKKIDA